MVFTVLDGRTAVRTVLAWMAVLAVAAGLSARSSADADEPDIAAAAIGPFAGACVETPTLPSQATGWQASFVGNYATAQNIVIDPSQMYAATTLSDAYRPVASVPVDNIQPLFRSRPGAIANFTGLGQWTGSLLEQASTMAMDGGGPTLDRTGKSYVWYWGTGHTPAANSDPDAPANSISLAEVLNNTGNAMPAGSNTRPNRLLHVPPPGTLLYNYWSGGEVDQQTGRIYLSSGEDATIGGDFRLMIFDPQTGAYANSGVLQPKTTADLNRFSGSAPASDMVIDGQGNAYIVSSGSGTPNPGTGASQTTKWLIKVEPFAGANGAWLYSGVTPLWYRSGTTYQAITGADIWGLAFYDGKLYMSGAGWTSSLGDGYQLAAADPLTGLTTRVPGAAGAVFYDLASAQSVAVLNGTVYDDLNRNGGEDAGEAGVPNQRVQLYDASGTVIGEQRTNASGEYSFLMPASANETDYHVRVVQPQLTIGGAAVNAAQTGIQVPGSEQPEPCGINTVQPRSFGADIDARTAPTAPSGSYIDYPAQTLGATNGTQTLSPDQMALSALYTVSTAQDLTTINFGISAQGSWGDAGNGVTSFNTQAAQNGPRHIRTGNAGDTPPVQLGDNAGLYPNGSLDNTHTGTDDGVTVQNTAGEWVSPEAMVFQPGQTYQFHADVNGPLADDATVRVWLSDRNANTFPNALSATPDASGNFSLTIPSTPTVTNPHAFLRVNVTSTSNPIGGWHYNGGTAAEMPYAPAQGSTPSQTRDWVINGETEDYAITLAGTALRVVAEGVPGVYSLQDMTNVTPPSSTGTVPAGGARTTIGYHAVLNTSTDIAMTLAIPGNVTLQAPLQILDPSGAVVGTAILQLPERRIIVPPSVWGTHTELTLVIRTSATFTLEGTKALGTIAYGTTETTATPDDWEITATDSGGNVTVLSGVPQTLDRTETYTIGERLVDNPSDDAAKHVRTGVMCTGSDGSPLPDGVFDPDTGTLAPNLQTAAIACTVTNTASQVTLLPTLVGGSAPGAGWSLHLASEDSQEFDSTLTDDESALVRPGEYLATATAPDGISLVGAQRLDLSEPSCAEHATNPSDAPASCWVRIPTALGPLSVTPGQHEVVRLVGATPATMPRLPLSGGVGSWVFGVAGAVALALAALLSLLRRRRSPQTQHVHTTEREVQ